MRSNGWSSETKMVPVRIMGLEIDTEGGIYKDKLSRLSYIYKGFLVRLLKDLILIWLKRIYRDPLSIC